MENNTSEERRAYQCACAVAAVLNTLCHYYFSQPVVRWESLVGCFLKIYIYIDLKIKTRQRRGIKAVLLSLIQHCLLTGLPCFEFAVFINQNCGIKKKKTAGTKKKEARKQNTHDSSKKKPGG